VSAYTIDISTADTVTSNLSVIGSSAGIGFVIGPAIGSYAVGAGPQTAVKLSVLLRYILKKQYSSSCNTLDSVGASTRAAAVQSGCTSVHSCYKYYCSEMQVHSACSAEHSAVLFCAIYEQCCSANPMPACQLRTFGFDNSNLTSTRLHHLG
jgi:hypothetical protein